MNESKQAMVTAAMRAFERFAMRLLRYPEKDRWHMNDVQGMREALKAALAIPSSDRGGVGCRCEDPNVCQSCPERSEDQS